MFKYTNLQNDIEISMSFFCIYKQKYFSHMATIKPNVKNTAKII